MCTFAYVRSTCMHLRIYDIQKQTHRQRHPYPHPATPCNTLQHPATPCNTLQHPATPCNVLQHHPTPPTHRRRMHCGVEVTESSTNKQHHLSHTCTQYRASLEKRLQQLYTVRNPTKIPDALSVSEEVHLCVCVSSLCVCFIFERVFHL